ncbi:MAG: pyridoxamine 5'-phosphate oxidase family protein [Gammaproteobacteria bacterium]|nr:pyridoxamine 5'-phosphate oxidase family protein [Gammaproteobacteria bacterium]
MDLHENWSEIKALFQQAFNSSFHYAIASVNENGEPHVTPIGSLILGKPGLGYYFEEFPQHLPQNLCSNNHVCILAVNSGRWFWLKSLLAGKFTSPPAVRLYGVVGDLRVATDQEMKHWQRRIRRVRFSKGHALIWRGMRRVREIEFNRIEPVHIGAMTRGLW